MVFLLHTSLELLKGSDQRGSPFLLRETRCDWFPSDRRAGQHPHSQYLQLVHREPKRQARLHCAIPLPLAWLPLLFEHVGFPVKGARVLSYLTPSAGCPVLHTVLGSAFGETP